MIKNGGSHIDVTVTVADNRTHSVSGSVTLLGATEDVNFSGK